MGDPQHPSGLNDVRGLQRRSGLSRDHLEKSSGIARTQIAAGGYVQ